MNILCQVLKTTYLSWQQVYVEVYSMYLRNWKKVDFREKNKLVHIKQEAHGPHGLTEKTVQINKHIIITLIKRKKTIITL